MNFATWLDKHLIDNWRKAIKSIGIYGTALAAAGAAVWVTLSDDQHAALLDLAHVNPKYAMPVGVAVAVYLRLKG